MTENLLRLAKPAFDICLCTNTIEPILAFWQNEVGLVRDEILPIRPGLTQYRYPVAGSVIKINHHEAPLAVGPAAGYRELIIARAGLTEEVRLTDPEGNRVSLVPPGSFGIGQIAVRTHVRDLVATRRFFDHALGLPTSSEPGGARVPVGESVLLLTEDPTAAFDPPVNGLGWRYLSLQIFDAYGLYDSIIERGGRPGLPPKTLGDIAKYALIRDIDGNWIELSQRASLTGPFEQ